MRKGWKILIGVLVALAVLLAINTLVVENETKSAEVTQPYGRILRTERGDVQVVDRGPRDGSPIVLLHCYTCSIEWWDRMMPMLVRDHRVVAIDLLGFGGSEKPGSGYSMNAQAALVAEVLDRLHVRDATVVGHSMGGSIAAALTEVSASPVARMVDIDQAPDNDYGDGPSFTQEMTFLPVLGPALWQVVPDSEIKSGLGVAFAPGYDVPDEFVEDFNRMTYTSYDDAAAEEDEFLSEEPLDSRLRAVGVPLLAIFGAEEQIYDPEKALAAFAKLPGAQTFLVPGAGHSPNVERPKLTAARILRFINQPQPKPLDQGGSGHELQEGVHNRSGVRGQP